MDALPYINLPQSQVPELLGGIGDTLIGAARARQEKKRQAAEMLLKQQDQQRQQQLANAQIANFQSEDKRRTAEEARITAQQHRQEGLDTSAAIPHIQALFDAGRVQEAHAMALANGIKLPAVGDKGPAPVAPGPPQLEQGPQVSPEDAQQAAIIRTQRDNPPPADGGPVDDDAALRANSEQAENDRRRFGSGNQTALAADALAQKNYGDATVAYDKRKPSFSGQSNIGPVTFDPNESDAADRAQAKKIQDRLAPILSAPGLGKYAGALGAMARTVKDEAGATMFMHAVQKAQEEAGKDEENLRTKQPQTDRERHERAMEAAAFANAHARQTSAGANIENRNDATTDRNYTTYQSAVKEFEDKAGVKPDVQTVKLIQKMKNEIGDPDSPVSQTASIDTISQIAQGGKASQGVINQINSHALGPLENAYDKAYRLAHNGAHSPAWIKSMQGALGDLDSYMKDEQGRVMSGFEAGAGDQSPFNGPEFSGVRDSHRRRIAAAMGMEVPAPRAPEEGAMRPGTGQRVHAPTVGDQLTGAAKGKSKQPSEDEVNRAMAAIAARRAAQ